MLKHKNVFSSVTPIDLLVKGVRLSWTVLQGSGDRRGT